MIEMVDIRNRLSSAEVHDLVGQLEYPLASFVREHGLLGLWRADLGRCVIENETNPSRIHCIDTTGPTSSVKVSPKDTTWSIVY